MYCFRCGASMPDTAATCPRCGAATTPTQPAFAAAAAPAPAPPPMQSSAARVQPYIGPPQTDGKAVGSLICGIFAIFPFGLFTGIPAVILGHLSRKSIRESLGRLKGDGMALAGLIMGYISIASIPLILIIAAIAIPSLLRARMLANESGAVTTVQAINTAQSTYSSVYGKGYAADLARLGSGSESSCAQPSEEHACLLDHVLANPTCKSGSWCTKSGYEFIVTATCGADGSCSEYVITATPVQQGTTGSKNFCSTSDLIVHEQSARAVVAPPTAAECQSWPPVS